MNRHKNYIKGTLNCKKKDEIKHFQLEITGNINASFGVANFKENENIEAAKERGKNRVERI